MSSEFLVQIQNYQIIEEAKLKFIDGLNIIVGPSNNGKSSILRAIEAAIYNKAGNSFIKNGKNAAVVAIKDNGHVVIWKKSQDGGVYKIDGQVYNKVGRGQPVEVANALGIGEVVINDDKVKINFLKQMEYPFLLDRTPSQLFEFLAMSNDTEKLTGVFNTMRSDLKRTNSDIDIINGKIDSYKNIISRDKTLLENYKDIDSVVDKVLDLDSKVVSYNSAEEKYNNLVLSREKLVDKKPKLSELREEVDKVNSSLEGLDDKVKTYQGLLTEVTPLENSYNDLKQRKVKIASLKEQLDQVDKAVQSIDIDKIKQLQETVSSMKKDIQDIESVKNILSSKKTSLDSHRKDLEEVNQEFSSFKVCPLCGQLLNDEHKEVHNG